MGSSSKIFYKNKELKEILRKASCEKPSQVNGPLSTFTRITLDLDLDLQTLE